MKKAKRYDEGGMTDEDVKSFAGTSENDSNAGMMEKEPEENFKSTPKKQTFGEAFAAARKSGGKTFEFEGKKFTTELAGSKSSAPKAKTEAKAEAKTEAKPKYQSLQDRAKSYEDARAKSGVGMYGTKKSEPKEERKPLPLKSTKSETGNSFMGATKMKNGGMTASRRADGIASKGKTRGKLC